MAFVPLCLSAVRPLVYAFYTPNVKHILFLTRQDNFVQRNQTRQLSDLKLRTSEALSAWRVQCTLRTVCSMYAVGRYSECTQFTKQRIRRGPFSIRVLPRRWTMKMNYVQVQSCSNKRTHSFRLRTMYTSDGKS